MNAPAFIDDHCAQCQQPLPRTNRSLYCGEWCGQTAKHIRYWRRIVQDGRINDPDVQLALQTRLAFVFAGGYPDRARRLTLAIRRQVLERDHHQCQSCGAPGEEIDHLHDSSADLDNLQLLCRPCHQVKTHQNMTPANDEQRTAVARLYADRVFPDRAALLCDDHEHWPLLWRALRTSRRRRLVQP